MSTREAQQNRNDEAAFEHARELSDTLRQPNDIWGLTFVDVSEGSSKNTKNRAGIMINAHYDSKTGSTTGHMVEGLAARHAVVANAYKQQFDGRLPLDKLTIDGKELPGLGVRYSIDDANALVRLDLHMMYYNEVFPAAAAALFRALITRHSASSDLSDYKAELGISFSATKQEKGWTKKAYDFVVRDVLSNGTVDADTLRQLFEQHATERV